MAIETVGMTEAQILADVARRAVNDNLPLMRRDRKWANEAPKLRMVSAIPRREEETMRGEMGKRERPTGITVPAPVAAER